MMGATTALFEFLATTVTTVKSEFLFFRIARTVNGVGHWLLH
jgi:hypothetical protein